MTTPREEQPQTEAPATPRVSTAPPRSRWRFGNVPSRLGRARTSTVVLAVLFVAVFVLYVYVRPPTTATAPAGNPGGTATDGVPAATTSQAPATTRTPTPTATTTAPSSAETTTESTTPAETTSSEATSTTRSSSTSRSPTGVGVPSTTVSAPTS